MHQKNTMKTDTKLMVKLVILVTLLIFSIYFKYFKTYIHDVGLIKTEQHMLSPGLNLKESIFLVERTEEVRLKNNIKDSVNKKALVILKSINFVLIICIIIFAFLITKLLFFKLLKLRTNIKKLNK
jgi:low temperature requirement protein LtrA